MAETLGVCEVCDRDVVYRDELTSDDPTYPTWEFYDDEDHLFHWGCLAPHLFGDRPVGCCSPPP